MITGQITVPDCTTPYNMEPIMWAWSSVGAIGLMIFLATVFYILRTTGKWNGRR